MKSSHFSVRRTKSRLKFRGRTSFFMIEEVVSRLLSIHFTPSIPDPPPLTESKYLGGDYLMNLQCDMTMQLTFLIEDCQKMSQILLTQYQSHRGPE